MRYLALATDYDGTLAHGGRVSESTLAALRSFRQSGRKIILVTGRVLSDLETVFSNFELFDSVVAENGALLYRPATAEIQLLAEPPPERFVRLAEKIREHDEITVRSADLKDFAAEAGRIKEIYDGAWDKTWGFLPMTTAEFAKL